MVSLRSQGGRHSADNGPAESLRRLRRRFSGRYRAMNGFYDKVSMEGEIALRMAENASASVSLKNKGNG